MIALTTKSGELVRVFSEEIENKKLGFHKLFGFSTEETAKHRSRGRALLGLPSKENWICQFTFTQDEKSNGKLNVAPVFGCDVKPSGDGWTLNTPLGEFFLQKAEAAKVDLRSKETPEENNNLRKIGFAIASFFLLFLLIPQPEPPVIEQEPILEPVEVRIVEMQRAVSVPVPKALKSVAAVAKKPSQEQEVRRAIQQKLGFLGLLGRKDLKKALGGAPTELKDASAGAGDGGKEGSGGELLTGIGQGVQKTTVGNTGVKGLGGIGTKGKGGGAGGYGNMRVGSGEAGRISALPVSSDVILEGGLDPSVIQATIAKYLSQVRACYEKGLRKNAGLSGQVTMSFEISPSGILNYSRVVKSTLGSSIVEGCIAERMMTWKFPKPIGGVNQKVASYPFMLRPVQ